MRMLLTFFEPIQKSAKSFRKLSALRSTSSKPPRLPLLLSSSTISLENSHRTMGDQKDFSLRILLVEFRTHNQQIANNAGCAHASVEFLQAQCISKKQCHCSKSDFPSQANRSFVIFVSTFLLKKELTLQQCSVVFCYCSAQIATKIIKSAGEKVGTARKWQLDQLD